MWIALGIIGALWFAGMAIWPDKNAPTLAANPPAHVAAANSPTASPTPATAARP